MKDKIKKRITIDTFCKAIVTVVLVHGIILTTASYVLAYLDKDPVAEVSTVLITEVLAPVITYIITNTVANVFEKNKLSFSTPLTHEWMMRNDSRKEYSEDVSDDEITELS